MRESEMNSFILRFGAKACAGFFILNLVSGAPFSIAESDRLPKAVEEAARALVKITGASHSGELLLAAGFALKSPDGAVFIATEYSLARTVLLSGASDLQIEDISARRIPGDVSIAAFDLANDLALLQAPGYSGPVLPLSDFKAVSPEDAHYQLSFVSGEKDEEKGGWERGEWNTAPSFVPEKSLEESRDELRYMEVFGLSADWTNSFYGYVHRINRRGGPLLDRNGAVVGAVFGHDRSYSVFGTKSSALAKMLKNAKAGRRLSSASFAKEMEKQTEDMKSAALAGDGEAAWTLARHYQNEDNKEEYEKQRDLALRAGNGRAFYFAALDWLKLGDYKRGLPALRAAADQGQSNAMRILASALLEGDVTGKDLKAGALLMQKAAKRQNPEAAGELAALYLSGKGLPKDIAKGMELLHDLERKGFADAREALERPAVRALFSNCQISIGAPLPGSKAGMQ